ncbi:MAG: metal-dependent transcriptional regulator [Chloroflexi bacterium]|nr:metal-dependent transcriptional regulator [Chloroflexota bacterium]
MQAQRSPAARRTPAVGEYLVRIYVQLREGRRVVGARLAEAMGVSPPAVTQALRRMTRDGLASQENEAGVQLTATGKAMAEATLRRHYLLERMLVDELGYNWAEVDNEADRMEHALSPELERYLYERLGRPTTCPHGNPFPGSADEQMLIKARTLAAARPGERVLMLRVTEEGEEEPELMHLLHGCGFLPHTRGRVLSVDQAKKTVCVEAPLGTMEAPLGLAQYVRVSEPLAD